MKTQYRKLYIVFCSNHRDGWELFATILQSNPIHLFTNYIKQLTEKKIHKRGLLKF